EIDLAGLRRTGASAVDGHGRGGGVPGPGAAAAVDGPLLQCRACEAPVALYGRVAVDAATCGRDLGLELDGARGLDDALHRQRVQIAASRSVDDGHRIEPPHGGTRGGGTVVRRIAAARRITAARRVARAVAGPIAAALVLSVPRAVGGHRGV